MTDQEIRKQAEKFAETEGNDIYNRMFTVEAKNPKDFAIACFEAGYKQNQKEIERLQRRNDELKMFLDGKEKDIKSFIAQHVNESERERKEIEELKQKIEQLKADNSKWSDVYSVTEGKRIDAEFDVIRFEQQLVEKDKQIEKMKCCYNCKHNHFLITENPDLPCIYKNRKQCKHFEHWELRE